MRRPAWGFPGRLLDHHRGAAVLAYGWAFFCALEQKLYRSRDLIAHSGQHLGGPHEHGRMTLMTAGMGHRERATGVVLINEG